LSNSLTITRRDPVNETLIVTAPAQTQADELVERAAGSALGGFYLVVDGTEVELGDSLSQLVAHVIEGAANRGSISVRTMPEEVSTTVAAQELGISRPTLMKMVRAGELPSHAVGSHTRLRYSDVREAAARINSLKNDAFTRLLNTSDSLGER
jgi:excisionase family DNA binding protein